MLRSMSRVLAFCLLAHPRLAVRAFAPWRCASESFSSSFSLVLGGGIDTEFHPEREIAWCIIQGDYLLPSVRRQRSEQLSVLDRHSHPLLGAHGVPGGTTA